MKPKSGQNMNKSIIQGNNGGEHAW